jgi:hypothetical protein
MRCPKCGFISFDHLTSCKKCGKDIAEVASELQGTSIKTESPMFLSPALAAFADREESFEEHAMEAEVGEGIDFSMEDEPVEEEAEAAATAEAEENIDFSVEQEEEESDMSLAEAEAEEAAGAEEETDESTDMALETEAVEEAAPEAAEESFEELDFMGTAEEEEEGGLEFDLEDFLEDMDDDKSKSSGS